jgi:small GTP-binding protein
MKKTIGIFAHVDAGKTTFSEQLLYDTGSIRNLGRVDHKTSHLDTNEIEQNRGITVFADQAVFSYRGDIYYLIDTPGHVDFSAETERSMRILDYAILLISGSDGVQAHTRTLFRLLKTYKIPTFFFINKTDLDSFREDTIFEDIKNKLTNDFLYLESMNDITQAIDRAAEFAAEHDERFMEAYLDENYTANLLQSTLVRLVQKQQCFLAMGGSALKGIGMDQFLEVFSAFSPTFYEHAEPEPAFIGEVYKVRHDSSGSRLTFIKTLAGKLHVRDEFLFEADDRKYSEKINEIRIYNGNKYETKNAVAVGEVFAVTGLRTPICGSHLTGGSTNSTVARQEDKYYLVPALQSKVNILDGTDKMICYEKLRILEAEDPALSVAAQQESGDLLVHVMGQIQLEVLEQLILSRFGISVSFEKPRVQYRETIESPVVGYGHFEPLRHYAEVQVRLEPTPRGTGITFDSECHVDILTSNYQNLIRTHVFEKVHKGILTGSPVADLRIVLQDGRAHLKHTTGGDFREATYRAIRQGLEKAQSVLLEPFYQFEINIPLEFLGRVMTDIQKMRGTYNPPQQTGKENVCIQGRGPVETFMDYSTQLVSFTKGNGSISLIFDGYDICGNAADVIEKIAYDKGADTANLSSSVFCAKGASFVVPWYEAEKYMHTI